AELARSQIVDPAHVRVAHRSRQHGFLPHGLFVTRHFRVFAHDLERDRLLHDAIEREVDLAHAPGSEPFSDLVPIVDNRSLTDRGDAAHGIIRKGAAEPPRRANSANGRPDQASSISRRSAMFESPMGRWAIGAARPFPSRRSYAAGRARSPLRGGAVA